jgi:hypothetical protein
MAPPAFRNSRRASLSVVGWPDTVRAPGHGALFVAAIVSGLPGDGKRHGRYIFIYVRPRDCLNDADPTKPTVNRAATPNGAQAIVAPIKIQP